MHTETPAFKDCQVFYLLDSGKYTGKFGNITGQLFQENNHQIQRFMNIAEWAYSIVKDCEQVFIEDYSMGSKGKVFHIAENTGILKYTLYKNKVKYATVPPTVVKKFASGKGNSKKEQMYEAFIKETGTDLIKLLSYEKQLGNPITDIVDSFYLAKYGSEKGL